MPEPDCALTALGMTLADRIGGGWPQPEYETCDICGRPNEDDEHHVTSRRGRSGNWYYCKSCLAGEILRGEPCPYVHISEYNGYEYCSHPDVGGMGYHPYCRPDPRSSGFRCPLGLSGKCWQPVNKAELERDGRQATLEGF